MDPNWLELQIRVPMTDGDWWKKGDDRLILALSDRLRGEHIGDVDDSEEEGGEICYYLYGPETERILNATRDIFAAYGVPKTAQVVIAQPPDYAQGSERMPLW